MREHRDGSPAGTGRGSRTRIQPSAATDSEDEELPADERLDRMLGDQDLLLKLQLSGYAPKYWNPAAAEFARYGHNVLTGWLYTNQIFTEVYKKTQRDLQRPDNRFDEDAVQTLATDTVVAALVAFLENVLKQKKWDPAKGATLKTFFIGQCCFQFSNAYRSWWRNEKRVRRTHEASDRLHNDKMSSDFPAADTTIIREAAAKEALDLLSTDVARRAFVMFNMGYSHAEIADELELADHKAVENLIGHQRRRIAEMKSEERAG